MLLSACDPGGKVCTALSPCEGDVQVPTSITLSSAALNFFSLGETQQLTVTVFDGNGLAISGATVTWVSSAPSVASVEATGLVTAVNVGSVTVTVTSGAASGIAQITVQQAAEAVTVSPGSLLLPGSGARASLLASVTDPGGSPIINPSLLWSSSDQTVATVNNGLVTGQAGGEATIKVIATSAGRSASADALVQVDRLGILSTSLPNAIVNNPYTTTLKAVAGDGSYTWVVTAGALPVGLTIAFSTGVISGTPTAIGTSTFTARVTDGRGNTGSADLAIRVLAGFPPLDVATQSLPNATVGVPYSQTVAGTGGDGSYTWSLNTGSLPPALSTLTIGGTTGTLGFTPPTGGVHPFTVQMTSGDGQNANRPFTLTIDDPLNDFPVAAILAPRQFSDEA